MIESRKTEIRYVTSAPKRMINKFIARRVLRTWTEDFVDEDTGNVVPIERNEILFEKGTYVDADVLSQIQYWIQEGSVKEVEVSNQKRMSFVQKNTALYPYKAKARIFDKHHTFLLYATSVCNALTILTDYIELNYNGGFTVSDVKELDYFIILIDSLKSPKKNETDVDLAYLKDEISTDEYVNAIDGQEHLDDENKGKLKFYQISSRIVSHHEKEGDEEETGQFIVQTYTAARANLLIEKYLRDKQEERYQESLKHPERTFVKYQINSFIEESKVIPIGCFIPLEFSKVYQEDDA